MKSTIFAPLALCLITLGLCMRFNGEKILVDLYTKKYNKIPSESTLKLCSYIGPALYIGGWLVGALCLSWQHKGNKILRNSVFSAILISVVWAVLEYREDSFVSNPKLPLISCSVLLSALIALVSLKYRTRDICSIVVAAILIVFAEYFVLPFQRTHNIHDGVGLPILVFGWFLLFKVFDGGLDTRVSFKLPREFDHKATELRSMMSDPERVL